ncbi:DUF99 family protein [Candidatus Woesearchaeota archaeon]|nr:DUF99 family protein [Candidatus Woesearchaeota archaeon]
MSPKSATKRKTLRTEIRVIGIDDASFDKFKDKKTLAIGVIFRGGNFLDGVISIPVQVDGDDGTEQLVQMINKSKFKPQLRCILLDGIAVGGFNVIDIQELSMKTKLPVIVVVRDYPNFEKIFTALKKLGMEWKRELMEKAGKPMRIGKVYVQLCNISQEKAKEILEITSTRSYLPEPIRVAHLIGQGIKYGESKGRA